MRTTLLPLALLGLALAAAPYALAEEPQPEDPARPADAAWTEDCPPDMMCAYSGNEGNGTDEPARGPADGSCENCRGADEPIPMGPEGCIECSGPAPTGEGTCMDGSAPAEQCDRDVQYLDGSAPATDTSHAPVNGESDDTDAKAVPAPALALLIVGAGVAMVLIGLRR